MACADTGRDPQYITELNPYGWCPTPANPGCVWFNLPWGGKQEITAESEAAILAEVAKQQQGTFQDYTALFIMLDNARCGSSGGFFVRNIDDGSLTPWTPAPPVVTSGPLDVSMPITPPVSGNGGATNITPNAGSTTSAAPQPAPAATPVQLVNTAAATTGEGIIEQGFDAITRALLFVLLGALLVFYLTR